jgi:hypothetical protein
VDYHTGERTHNSAVDPDELQVPTYRALDPVGRVGTVPAVNSGADEVGNLVTRRPDNTRNGTFDATIEPSAQIVIRVQRIGETANTAAYEGHQLITAERPVRL